VGIAPVRAGCSVPLSSIRIRLRNCLAVHDRFHKHLFWAFSCFKKGGWIQIREEWRLTCLPGNQPRIWDCVNSMDVRMLCYKFLKTGRLGG